MAARRVPRSALLAVAAVALVGGVACSAPTAPAPGGAPTPAAPGLQGLLGSAHQGLQGLVALGTLGQQQGAAEQVKALGGQLVTTHTRIDSQLTEAANAANVTVPGGVPADLQATLTQLRGQGRGTVRSGVAAGRRWPAARRRGRGTSHPGLAGRVVTSQSRGPGRAGRADLRPGADAGGPGCCRRSGQRWWSWLGRRARRWHGLGQRRRLRQHPTARCERRYRRPGSDGLDRAAGGRARRDRRAAAPWRGSRAATPVETFRALT